MKRFVLLCILQVFIAGCSTVPFQETRLVPLDSEDPGNVVEHFRSNVPDSFELLNTVVFEYNGRKFTAIGTIRINRADGVFKVAGMNPMGIKLFELSGDQNSVTTRYSIANLTRYGDIAAMVGNDIRRMYFDLVPGPEARSWKRKYTQIFRQPSGSGFLEYVFAGRDGDLIEKRYYEEKGIVWKASYYEYQDQDGKRWPQGIVFIHYSFGYRLIVRQKEFRIEHN
jgi:Protein of unknown function (DUF3261)